MSGNVFEDTDATSIILVEGDTSINEDATWADQGPAYQVTERDLTFVKDGITPATLTLDPGVEIRFELDRGIDIGSSTSQGGLIAVGAPSDPWLLCELSTLAATFTFPTSISPFTMPVPIPSATPVCLPFCAQAAVIDLVTFSVRYSNALDCVIGP